MSTLPIYPTNSTSPPSRTPPTSPPWGTPTTTSALLRRTRIPMLRTPIRTTRAVGGRGGGSPMTPRRTRQRRGEARSHRESEREKGERERDMGGGVMRTAAKVGIAGSAAAAAGGRFRHAAPAFATAPAAEAAAPAPLVSAVGEVPAAAATGAQWASWEVDDWEFADWRDAAVAEAEETAVGKPRLVFAPPSREEAEEATTELRDAIERVYFSEAPVEVVKEQDKELNKLGADAIIPAMPGHVVQAFTLLKSSPEAQSVVASLASDKNVWDAVLKNDKVMEFYKIHQQTLVHTFPEDTATVESPEKFEDASSENASPFSYFVDNAKKTVMEIVDNITHFFQDMFRNPAEAHSGTSSSAEKGSSHSFAEVAAGGSFVALAIAVILVVLFKRG